MRQTILIRARSLHRTGRLVPPHARALRAGAVSLRPGEVMGWHSTGTREELLIVLEGCVRVERRSRERLGAMALAAGQSLFLPSRTRHRVVNRSGTAARYIYITAPIT